MEEGLICGFVCVSLSVTALGGNTGFPTEEKLETFIKNQETIERNKLRQKGGKGYENCS